MSLILRTNSLRNYNLNIASNNNTRVTENVLGYVCDATVKINVNWQCALYSIEISWTFKKFVSSGFVRSNPTFAEGKRSDPMKYFRSMLNSFHISYSVLFSKLKRNFIVERTFIGELMRWFYIFSSIATIFTYRKIRIYLHIYHKRQLCIIA